MNQREGIHNVKGGAAQEAGVFGDNRIVVVGLGVGDARASGRHTVQPPFE